MRLTSDILAEARAELEAWEVRRYERTQGRRRRALGKHARAPRPCHCGCGGLEWNRTGLCQAAYSRRYRVQQQGQQPVRGSGKGKGHGLKSDRRVCRCGDYVISHDRCRRCYHAYRRLNPKLCDCGRYHHRHGTKCPRCVARTVRENRWAKLGERCPCGNKSSFLNGDCRRCRREAIKHELPRCSRGCGRPVVAKELCGTCYANAYKKTPKGRRRDRIYRRKHWRRTYQPKTEAKARAAR